VKSLQKLSARPPRWLRRVGLPSRELSVVHQSPKGGLAGKARRFRLHLARAPSPSLHCPTYAAHVRDESAYVLCCASRDSWDSQQTFVFPCPPQQACQAPRASEWRGRTGAHTADGSFLLLSSSSEPLTCLILPYSAWERPTLPLVLELLTCLSPQLGIGVWRDSRPAMRGRNRLRVYYGRGLSSMSGIHMHEHPTTTDLFMCPT
jgi:hypothetical protein